MVFKKNKNTLYNVKVIQGKEVIKAKFEVLAAKI